MEEEVIIQPESLTNILRVQWDTLLVYLARPAVQRQVIVIAVVIMLVWLVPTLIRRWQSRRVAPASNDGTQPASSRWITMFRPLIAPIIGLIISQVAIWIFEQRGNPNGLLDNSLYIFWLWLIYRALSIVIKARFGDVSKPYLRWVLTPIFIYLVLSEVLDSIFGLSILGEIVIVGGVLSVTLNQFFTAIVVLYIFIILSKITNDVLTTNLPRWVPADPGVYNTVITLSRYTLIAFGIVASLAALGVNLSSLALVAGGLSVGIGLGLQDIIVNFVSGLVLLFEQSLRPGDVVDVDGKLGIVENLSIRATTIRDRNNVEVIIPNGKFTTTQVRTFTGEDTEVRVLIPFGVAYDSAPDVVRELAKETARRHNLVQQQPPPVVRFRGFGNSSLDFDLGIWINQPQLQREIASDLYFMLFKAFGNAGITIPFPQRDLNLGKGWENMLPQLEVDE
jgi:small-conductance mechanosensitive channel